MTGIYAENGPSGTAGTAASVQGRRALAAMPDRLPWAMLAEGPDRPIHRQGDVLEPAR